MPRLRRTARQISGRQVRRPVQEPDQASHRGWRGRGRWASQKRRVPAESGAVRRNPGAGRRAVSHETAGDSDFGGVRGRTPARGGQARRYAGASWRRTSRLYPAERAAGTGLRHRRGWWNIAPWTGAQAGQGHVGTGAGGQDGASPRAAVCAVQGQNHPERIPRAGRRPSRPN